MTSAMAERPYIRLRWVTGTLPGRNPLIRIRLFNSSRRALTLASSSAAGTTTLYSRLRPSDSVSVTCIGHFISACTYTAGTHHCTARRSRRRTRTVVCLVLVRAEGLEPPRLSALEPKSRPCANSATPAEGQITDDFGAANRHGLTRRCPPRQGLTVALGPYHSLRANKGK